MQFNVDIAVKTIASLMRDFGISRDELLEEFPNRPTTEEQCTKIALWLSARIKEKQNNTTSVSSPIPTPPAPQVKLPANADKNGKARPTYYAVTLPGEDRLRFFRVKAGRKEGFYFVDEQASDDLYPVRQGARKGTILGTIMKDPEAAMRRYGQEIGRCSRCGRTLTDPVSREFGIGPDCRSK